LIIKSCSVDLETVRANLSISDDEFERYLEDERQYLSGLKTEPPEETLKYQYVEALQELAAAQLVTVLLFWSCIRITFISGPNGNRGRKGSGSSIRHTHPHMAFISCSWEQIGKFATPPTISDELNNASSKLKPSLRYVIGGHPPHPTTILFSRT
jgi:hypothetical protein